MEKSEIENRPAFYVNDTFWIGPDLASSRANKRNKDSIILLVHVTIKTKVYYKQLKLTSV